MRLISAALPTPLRRHFDYVLPQGMPEVAPGTRLRLPFGRRELIGLSLAPPRPASAEERTQSHWREVLAVLDPRPVLQSELLGSLRWAADYYHHGIGEVIAAALPAALRTGQPLDAEEDWAEITDAGRDWLAATTTRAPAQRKLLAALAERPRPCAGLDRRALRLLCERGLARMVARRSPPAGPPTPSGASNRGQAIALSTEQAAVCSALPQVDFGVTLLEGATGSGKTELYLEQARHHLDAGAQVLLLVPEIGLTPQLLARAEARLGERVLAFHSGLTDSARLSAWRRIEAGEPLLVVGTRSAVWLPFRQLALVCVDEEHDTSFKQQDGFRYSARDVAIVRARHFGAPVVLGTATPSLETLHNARSGRYQRLTLARRAEAAGARLRLIDARGQRLKGGLTPALRQSLAEHVGRGDQALIFVNRRGFAPALLCRDCGWAAGCRACDARLTWHRGRDRLLCHHCGAQTPVPVTCPGCGSNALAPLGHGTERVEEQLQTLLPGAVIRRVDSDAMQRRGAWQKLRAEVLTGDVQVLVGTQMLAKGHDFPGISLVGILSVDQGLFSADLRASERMGQLVVQVSGRAGRGARAGEVLLQTHAPEHPLLRTLLAQGYDAFAEALLAERASMGLPPGHALALLRADSVQESAAMAFLQAAARLLRAPGVEVLGPVPAPMMRRANRHRAQLWLQAGQRRRLQQVLSQACPAIEQLKQARRVRWGVDVDPADTL